MAMPAKKLIWFERDTTLGRMGFCCFDIARCHFWGGGISALLWRMEMTARLA
jgi:hypothetical protein